MSDHAQLKGDFAFFNRKPAQSDVLAEVKVGLQQEPKRISPKYFYDERGSKLFEQITQLDEYYLTRTELELFDICLPEVAKLLPERLCLLEYGSGSSLKIRKVLNEIVPTAYVPIDISAEHLKQNALALHADFPGLAVYPVCADITQQVELPPGLEELTKVAFFPGSSIGNFDPDEASDFLENVRQTIGSGGYLLIGVDRKKNREVLEAAYNDARGVTAEFNLNVLHHLNSQMRADFAVDQFEHVANYNEEEGCIQMFLRSKAEQVVTIADIHVALDEDELVHTENSFKYHPDEFQNLAALAGYTLVERFDDARDWFSIYLLCAD